MSDARHVPYSEYSKMSNNEMATQVSLSLRRKLPKMEKSRFLHSSVRIYEVPMGEYYFKRQGVTLVSKNLEEYVWEVCPRYLMCFPQHVLLNARLLHAFLFWVVVFFLFPSHDKRSSHHSCTLTPDDLAD
jgi:hypothetical protein